MALQDHLNLLAVTGAAGDEKLAMEKFIRELPSDSKYMKALDALSDMPSTNVVGKSKREVVGEAVRVGKILTQL
jgi:hypothetical protein